MNSSFPYLFPFRSSTLPGVDISAQNNFIPYTPSPTQFSSPSQSFSPLPSPLTSSFSNSINTIVEQNLSTIVDLPIYPSQPNLNETVLSSNVSSQEQNYNNIKLSYSLPSTPLFSSSSMANVNTQDRQPSFLSDISLKPYFKAMSERTIAATPTTSDNSHFNAISSSHMRSNSLPILPLLNPIGSSYNFPSFYSMNSDQFMPSKDLFNNSYHMVKSDSNSMTSHSIIISDIMVNKTKILSIHEKSKRKTKLKELILNEQNCRNLYFEIGNIEAIDKLRDSNSSGICNDNSNSYNGSYSEMISHDYSYQKNALSQINDGNDIIISYYEVVTRIKNKKSRVANKRKKVKQEDDEEGEEEEDNDDEDEDEENKYDEIENQGLIKQIFEEGPKQKFVHSSPYIIGDSTEILYNSKLGRKNNYYFFIITKGHGILFISEPIMIITNRRKKN
ncbi:hypothetical protein H8356DRAFT_1072830 [Neocallimastix lanati (nom. inval.)]|nr:hypothetical protein H8356DRAFT_1072830 [Neocallimastix sp. JGI-2020a]